NTFIAAITLIFVYKRVGDFKEINKEFFWLIFFVSSCGYAFMVNGVRQSVAIAIFFYATRYIYSKNFIKYSIFILLASSIHFSALLLFPIYLIDKIKITPLIGVIIFTLSIILSFLHLPDKFFTVILSTFGYSNLVESGIGSVPRNTGLGIIARIIFFYAIYFLSFCKRQKVGMFFTFFVIASSWSFLFMEHMAIARVYLYFEIFSIVYILTLIKLRFSGLSYGIALMFYLIFNLTLFQATVSNPKFNLEYNCICNR
ncbi:MAG TPA: hypothetical protein DER56_02200, partial [Thermosipho africanus]|nr:hypothetical protein [Thermosipho africanus]